MDDNFISESGRRIWFKMRENNGIGTPDIKYQTYVRMVRAKKGMNRDALTQKAGVDSLFLTFLENGNLYPHEWTKEVQEKLESVLGITYEQFMALNQEVVEQYIKDMGQLLLLNFTKT